MVLQVPQVPQVVQDHQVQQAVQDHQVHQVQMVILEVLLLNINGLLVRLYLTQVQEN